MARSISDICIVFARKGGRAYDGAPVTQLEHALQAAARTEDAGAPPALVAAALLHDLGRLLSDQSETPTLRGVGAGSGAAHRASSARVMAVRAG